MPVYRKVDEVWTVYLKGTNNTLSVAAADE
jgi:hypothetical protein